MERKKLIAEMLANPDDFQTSLDSAVACLVTVDEHIRLGRVDPALGGWDRYVAAGIMVLDMGSELALHPVSAPPASILVEQRLKSR